MGTIRRPLGYGNGGTQSNALIQCIKGQEPQIHKFWCLGLDGICCKVHPTACGEVPAGTVGDFFTDYLAENGRQIPIIGQLSINNSVQFLHF